MSEGAVVAGEVAGLDVEVHALQTQAELDACVELQRDTWGADYQDVVPASILQVAQKVGGVAAGAFVGGELVGFVFGLTGTRRGRLVHWSHMLAVRQDLRDHGIGRHLKEFQRRRLGEQGVSVMHWTFDPLVARNAHLNLDRLGVEVEEYVREMYGDTGSALHRFGTDRFVVGWATDGSGDARPKAEWSEWRETPVLNAGAAEALPGGGRVRIEIPLDVEALYGRSPEEALQWRRTTRSAFRRCFEEGYRVAGFHREASGGRCFYLLERSESGHPVRYLDRGSAGSP